MISQHLFTSDQISGKKLLIDEISTDSLNITNDLDVGGEIACTGDVGIGIADPNFKLHVIGDTNLDGDLTVEANSSFNQDVVISGDLNAKGQSIFDGDVIANENLSVKKQFEVTGNATFNGDVTAKQNLSVEKELDVAETATFNGDVIANENLSVKKQLEVTGKSTFNSDVVFEQAINVSGDFNYNGDTPLAVQNGVLEISEADSAPSPTTNKLYNLNGGLFWNGVDILNSTDTIAELEDTNISSLGNGDLLIYNDTTDKWVNANLTAGTNVSITNSAGGITISSTDVDVSLTNLKSKLSSNLGTLTIGDSNDLVKINGSLEVIGTTTTNNVEVVSTSNGVIFEGSATDDFEGTLKAGTLTADRTYTLPNKGGTVAMTSDIPTNNNQLTNGAGYITDGNTNWNNSYGFITASSSETLTNKSGNISMFTNNVGYLTSHPNINAASSSNNSGRTYIQDIAVDANGHVTSIATATETVVNTNTTYSAGLGLNLNGTTFSIENDLRGEVQYIGPFATDYIFVNNTYMDFVLDTNVDMKLVNDGNLHVDGDVVSFSTTTSDQRLKDNINTIDNALYKVNKLRGVEFEWNATSRKGQRDIGVVAQEVEEVLPEIVREKTPCVGEFCENTEKYKTVDYQKLTAVLIEAVKELSAEVEDLKKKLS